jgi:hypothetical protein
MQDEFGYQGAGLHSQSTKNPLAYESRKVRIRNGSSLYCDAYATLDLFQPPLSGHAPDR